MVVTLSAGSHTFLFSQIPHKVIALAKSDDKQSFTPKKGIKTLEKGIHEVKNNLKMILKSGSIVAGYEPPQIDVLVVNKDNKILSDFASPEDGKSKKIRIRVKVIKTHDFGWTQKEEKGKLSKQLTVHGIDNDKAVSACMTT